MWRTMWQLPRSGRIMLASLLGRAPTSMFDVALVLFVAERSNLGVAGLAAGISNALGAMSAPIQGRLLDRHGRRLLAGLTLLHLLLLLALLQLWSAPALVVGSVLLGLGRPPLSSVIRAGWSRLAAPRDISLTANRFETLTSNVTTVVGPLVCAGALAWSGPAAALAVAGAGVSLGGMLLCSCPRLFAGAAPGVRSPRPQLWRQPAFVHLLGVAVCAGLATGALQVGLPALALQTHHPAWAGLWWGAPAAGGMLFTLLLAGRGWWRRSLAGLLALQAAVLAGALLLPRPLGLLAGLLLVGLVAGAAALAAYQAAQRLSSLSGLTEAFAAKGASAYVGVGLGAAGLGSLAAQQANWALACAPLCLLLAATLSHIWRVEWREG